MHNRYANVCISDELIFLRGRSSPWALCVVEMQLPRLRLFVPELCVHVVCCNGGIGELRQVQVQIHMHC